MRKFIYALAWHILLWPAVSYGTTWDTEKEVSDYPMMTKGTEPIFIFPYLSLGTATIFLLTNGVSTFVAICNKV